MQERLQKRKLEVLKRRQAQANMLGDMDNGEEVDQEELERRAEEEMEDLLEEMMEDEMQE